MTMLRSRSLIHSSNEGDDEAIVATEAATQFTSSVEYGACIYEGGLLYVSGHLRVSFNITPRLWIYSVSGTSLTLVGGPVISGTSGGTGFSDPGMFFKSGDNVFISCGNRLYAIDVSDPTDPTYISSLTDSLWTASTIHSFYSTAQQGNHTFAAWGAISGVSLARVYSVDISNPAAMVIDDELSLGINGTISGNYVKDGNYLYVTIDTSGVNNSQVLAIDVSDPSNMSIAGSLTSLPDFASMRIVAKNGRIMAASVNRGPAELRSFAYSGASIGSHNQIDSLDISPYTFDNESSVGITGTSLLAKVRDAGSGQNYLRKYTPDFSSYTDYAFGGDLFNQEIYFVDVFAGGLLVMVGPNRIFTGHLF